MSETRNETTLIQVRLHGGIFILPVLTTFLLAMPAFLILILLHSMYNAIGQLNPQVAHSGLGLISLIVFLPAVLVGSLLLLAVWIAYVKSIITLTNRRLMYRTGLIMKVAGELRLW